MSKHGPNVCRECSGTIVAVTADVDAQTIGHRFTAQCGHTLPDGQAHALWRAGMRWTVPVIDGISLGAAERVRQVQEEGYTPADDAAYESNDLAWAAWSYLDRAASGETVEEPPTMWPWAPGVWKPDKTPMRKLIIALALVAAEIDRRLLAERANPEEK